MTTSAALLTAPGGTLDDGPALRNKCAIHDDGTVLVLHNHGSDSDVGAVLAAARRMGVPLGPVEYVDLGRIREVYGQPASTRDQSARPKGVVKQELLRLLQDAAERQATDLDVVVETDTRMMMRIDGDITGHVTWKGAHFGHQLCRAAYTACTQQDANYDLTRQQGAALARDDQNNDFREGWPAEVNALRFQFNPVGPGGRGRHMSMRLLFDRGAVGSDFAGLGFSPAQEAGFRALMEDPFGLGFFSGPTGSGKSTGLECLMRQIGDLYPGEKLMSVEDPPEFKMEKVIQLAVMNTRGEEDRGKAFTEAIAGCMRSNPDRMMVGEVRTLSSAKLLFEFALTGHPAYSTIHANSAMAIPARLLEMGVEPFLVRDPGIVRFLEAQRLVRQLCRHCRIPVTDPVGSLVEHMNRVGGASLFRHNPEGCRQCRQGFIGRTVVAEAALPDERLLDLLCQGRRTEAEAYWQNELGGRSMVEHALDKVAAGALSVESVRFDEARRQWTLRKPGRQ